MIYRACRIGCLVVLHLIVSEPSFLGENKLPQASWTTSSTTVNLQPSSMDEKRISTDPPSSLDVVRSGYIKPQHRKPHDPDVSFEEYYYYAQRTRKEEMTLEAPSLRWREVLLRKKTVHNEINGDSGMYVSEDILADTKHRLEITDEEWTNASRMFRTASWGACKCAVHPCIADINVLEASI
jgi:hypothetical protein